MDALSGHGGKLEEKMRLFCHSIPNAEHMNHRLYQRYKPFHYDDYTDFLRKNQNARYANPSKGDFKDDKLKMEHARKMMTGHMLYAESKDSKFDQAAYENLYQNIDHAPLFQLMTMNEQRLNILNAGSPSEAIDTMQQITTDFAPKEKPKGGVEADRKVTRQALTEVYYRLTDGLDGKKAQKYLEGKDPAYRRMAKEVESFLEEDFSLKPVHAMSLFSAAREYQKGREKDTDEAFETSMELMKIVTEGTKAEKYLKEQIDIINQKRGIGPEQVQNKKRLDIEKVYSWKDHFLGDLIEENKQRENAEKAREQAAQKK